MTARAIILFAHGARDPRWAAPFETIAAALRQARPDHQVHLAYLEFMSPSLLEAGQQAVSAGAAQVAVVPLFLGAGGHVRKDLPALLERLAHDHPQVSFQLEAAIGERAAVVQAMAQAAADVNWRDPTTEGPVA